MVISHQESTIGCKPADHLLAKRAGASPAAVAGSLVRLLTWLSPAFPIGGFAYSHGLEWAVEAGDAGDEAALQTWIGNLICFGSLRNDAILLRAAAAAGSMDDLDHVAELAAASAPGRERQEETLAQGGAFCLAAAPWMVPTLASLQARAGERISYPVAVGVLAAGHGIDENATCLAFLHACVTNLVSAGVRLIPLGQNAGLRVLAALEPALVTLAQDSAGWGLDELGGACLHADIASMRHETQYTRLFRS